VIQINRNELIAKLRETGIKATPQRLAICEEILSRKDHPTVELIHLSLEKKFPTLSRATIYKTLQVLKKLALIQEVESTEGGIRFDPKKDLHVNLICVKCGTIQDVTTDSLPQLWSTLITEIGVKPQGQLLNVYYTCKKCK